MSTTAEINLRPTAAGPNHHCDNCSQWDNSFPLQQVAVSTADLSSTSAAGSLGDLLTCWFENSLKGCTVCMWALFCTCAFNACLFVCRVSAWNACKCIPMLCFYSEDYTTSAVSWDKISLSLSSIKPCHWTFPSPGPTKSVSERKMKHLSTATTKGRVGAEANSKAFTGITEVDITSKPWSWGPLTYKNMPLKGSSCKNQKAHWYG